MIELLVDQANFCTPGETRDPIAVVEQFVSAYNAHDLKQLRLLVTADAVFGSPSERLSGEQVLENYESIVFARFPAVRMIVEQRIASGRFGRAARYHRGNRRP